MKIAGFEIKRALTAAQPSAVTIPLAQQKTEESIPLKRAFPRAELGDSGTRIMHGIVHEDYNSQLQGIAGIRVFDEMRKSDGTVRAAMLATTLPIRRADWFIKPGTEDPQGLEIAQFAERALFEWIEDMTWDDIIRQALLMVPFGVMVFEKVYGTYDFEGKTYVTLKKLSPRLPRSIQQWELKDGTFGIQQVRQDGVQAQIPGSKLLIFVNEREGDNWWGTSMLRAAYKHWYYKDNFYKIDAVAFERQGLGIPKITMPNGYTEADEAKAKTAMQNLRANEDAFLLLPPDYTAEFMNMGSQTTRDPERSIGHHNRQILASVLAQFLELGATTVGSKALSNDHSDLFLKAMEAIANTFRDEINDDLIKELVDLNYDNIDTYPKLDYSGISKVNIEALSTAFGALVTAGALKPTDDDQQYLRSVLGLPPRSQDDIDEQNIDEPVVDDTVPPADPNNPAPPTPPADPKKPDAPVAKAVKKNAPAPDTKKDNKLVDESVPKAKNTAHEHGKKARIFDDGSGFKSWRPLTFAEGKVSWDKIEKTMSDIESEFTAEATQVINDAKDVFMKKLHTAIEEGDTKAISDLEIKFISDYKALLKDAMKKAYEYGKNNVSTEMGVQVPPNSAASIAQIDLMADTIANKTATDIETKAKTTAANAMKKDVSTLQTVGAIDLALEEAITKAINNTAGIIIGQGINNGRNDVFQRNTGMIHALQRSEILDMDTCDFCLSMDGLIVEPTDSWAKTDIFHSNCRGIWVEILNDEQELPDVTGVPDKLGDHFGGEPNDLIQPKKPIVQPGSLAEDEVKRREALKNK